jgi:hypothetical protein
MTERELWLLSLAVAAVVVVTVALLLGLVIALLKSIDRRAADVVTAGKQIAQNTVALWTLEQTNRDLVAIRDAARGAAHAGEGSSVVAPLSAVTDKVRGLVTRDQRDDKDS